MSAYAIPVLMIEINVSFQKLKKPGEIDFEKLGIDDEEYDYSNDVIEPAKFQVDRISGYTPLRRDGFPEATLFWFEGYKFWANMSYNDFDKMYTEKIKEYNNLIFRRD